MLQLKFALLSTGVLSVGYPIYPSQLPLLSTPQAARSLGPQELRVWGPRGSKTWDDFHGCVGPQPLYNPTVGALIIRMGFGGLL